MVKDPTLPGRAADLQAALVHEAMAWDGSGSSGAGRARGILERALGITARLGSMRVLQASEASLPWQKGSLASDGLELLDAVLKKRPDDVELRFPRGVSTRELPGLIERFNLD